MIIDYLRIFFDIFGLRSVISVKWKGKNLEFRIEKATGFYNERTGIEYRKRNVEFRISDCRGGLGPPPKKIDGFHIVRIEIATVGYGSFAMTLLVHFLLHTS